VSKLQFLNARSISKVDNLNDIQNDRFYPDWNKTCQRFQINESWFSVACVRLSATPHDTRGSRLCPPPVRNAVFLHSQTLLCTARFTAEGCQSNGGNADRDGAEAMKLHPSLHCLLLTNTPWLKPRHVKTSCHSQNRKFITYCIVVRGELSHSHR